MDKYILVVLFEMWSGSGVAVSASSAEFFGYETCIAAKTHLESQTSKAYGKRITAHCYKK